MIWQSSCIRQMSLLLMTLSLLSPSIADEWLQPLRVGITPALESLAVKHQQEWVWLERNQHSNNLIHSGYALTSRDCPPFCIQPMTLAAGVDTLGELELISYLQRQSHDDTIKVIDARSSAEHRSGTIPGSTGVSWTDLVIAAGAVDFLIEERLSDFGVKLDGGTADFAQARTLAVYDNGPWCGQAASMIHALLGMGYPPERIKWYRGGLQAWHSLGLTVITP